MCAGRGGAHRARAGAGWRRRTTERGPVHLDRVTVDTLAVRQGGVLTAAQLRDLGADRAWVSRQVSAGRWQRLHRGVVATYSGPIAWRSRAWAAVLYAGRGAALSHGAAAFRHDVVDRPPRRVDVRVPEHRRVAPSPGIVIHRSTSPIRASGRPRTVWRGDAVVDLVSAARSIDDVVGWVCAGARAGAGPAELLDAAGQRGLFRNAGLLREVVAEVEAGIESPLERRYHRDVERRHRLPRARLQVREVLQGLWIRADAVYDGYGVRTELDGNLGHPGGRTDADTWRDNTVLLATGDVTLRYRWRHVAVHPCTTAAQVALALRRGGWTGTPHRCHATCPLTP